MTVIISSTRDSLYSFFVPIVSWGWNKLGVKVICTAPKNFQEDKKFSLINETMIKNCSLDNGFLYFDAPEHKEATYSQLSRLLVCAFKGIDDSEIFCSSDADMLNFVIPPYDNNYDFTIWGSDLTAKDQYPVCYCSSTKANWNKYFNPNKLNYQDALDSYLGKIECDHFKGNYWCFEQEQLFNKLQGAILNLIPRTNGQTPFATHRVDRTDLHYMDRLNLDIYDAHLWRPGYQEENITKIIDLLKFFYPNEDLNWIRTYTEKYKALL